MRLSPRQRLSAAYFRLRYLLFRRLGPEYYALVERFDTAGRKTISGADVTFDMPLDWRAQARAHSNTSVYLWALRILWVLFYQAWLASRLGIGLTQFWWWLPGGLLPRLMEQVGSSFLVLLHRLVPSFSVQAQAFSSVAGFPVGSLVALVLGLIVIEGVHRYVLLAQSMDRSGLSTEFGSVCWAPPEETASSDPTENMYPPGYDIWGGFDESSRHRRAVNLEAIDNFKRAVAERKRRSKVAEIELDLPKAMPAQRQLALPGPPTLSDEIDRLLAGDQP